MSWYICLAVSVLAWGGYNVLFKFATNKLDFFLALSIIGTTHVLTALPWVVGKYLKSGMIRYSVHGIELSILMGVLLTIGGWAYASVYESGAPASIVTPIYGVGVLLLGIVIGVLFLGEPVTPKRALGFLCGIISIVILTSEV
jgi:drug/metabolite transporter (DMT)-like permease